LIDDFTILGIEKTNDIGLIKAAYRKRVKEIHPDICPDNDKFRNHLLFIEINKA
jgi:curved DNA-binding protein CbpA